MPPITFFEAERCYLAFANEINMRILFLVALRGATTALLGTRFKDLNIWCRSVGLNLFLGLGTFSAVVQNMDGINS